MSASAAAWRAARTAAHQDRMATLAGFGTDPEAASAQLASVHALLRRYREAREAQEPGSVAREARAEFERRHAADSTDRKVFGWLIDTCGGGVDYSLAWGAEMRGLSQLAPGSSLRESCARPVRALGAGAWGAALHDAFAATPRCDACGAADTPARPLRKCGACAPAFAALYCDATCAARGWHEGGHKRACGAIKRLLFDRDAPFVQRAGGERDADVEALLSSRRGGGSHQHNDDSSLLATVHALLRRFADVICRNEVLHFAVQDGMLSPEALLDKLRRGAFMPPPPGVFTPPARRGGLTRHEAWLLFAALGEHGAARAGDVALDALYQYAEALWAERYAVRVNYSSARTPEEEEEHQAMLAQLHALTARDVRSPVALRGNEERGGAR
jgi:hypothetical protein